MSPSSPGGTRQPFRSSRARQAWRGQSSLSETFAFFLGSAPLVVAAVAVIVARNYLAYLIGRKQVSYDELRKQVDRIVELVDQKRVGEELVTAAPKQQDKFEQNGSALTDLTTSTINGKTTVGSEPPSAGKPLAASLINDTAAAMPARGMSVLPPLPPLTAAAKHRETHPVVHQRAARRQKASPAPAVTTAVTAAPDVSLANQ